MSLSDRADRERPVLLIGCGRMGTALARGWLRHGLAPDALAVVEPAGRPPLRDEVAYAASLAELPTGITPAAVIIAVKPQKIDSVLPHLKAFSAAEPLLLSIAAGIELASLCRALPAAVRAMPNLPASIGKGISAAVAGPEVSEEQRGLADALLAAAGEVVWLEDEALIDVVTAVSGSGPAYVYALAEAMATAGHAQGLPGAVAARIARAAVIGATHLLEQSGGSPESLREQVTSPGGTTAAALEVLQREDALESLIEQAVQAAARRSRELAGGG